jgi:hypothetical protein
MPRVEHYAVVFQNRPDSVRFFIVILLGQKNMALNLFRRRTRPAFVSRRPVPLDLCV